MAKQTPSIISLLLFPLLFTLTEVEGAKKTYGVYDSNPVKLFVFGDSYVDTGNFVHSESYKIPNGITFPGKPAGRFCDGRILTDYVASFLKIESPIPYTFSNSSNMQYGINFAYGGTGIFNTSVDGPNLTVQIDEFEKLIEQKNYTEQDIQSSIALVNAGANDYTTAVKNGQILNLPHLRESLVKQMSVNLKRIQSLGINKIAIGLLQPIGCLPVLNVISLRTNCIDILNLVSEDHNKMLLQAIQEFNKEIGKSVLITLDLYNSFLSAITTIKQRRAENSTLMNPLQPCCEGVILGDLCGTVDDKGSKKYRLCDNPTLSFFWDTVHLSQNGWSAVGEGAKNKPNNHENLALDERSDSKVVMPMETTSSESSNGTSWYLFGHLNFKDLHLLTNHKMTRGSFSRFVPTKTTEKLGVIHSDIETLEGGRYFFSFMDDLTRKIWIYLIKRKHEVLYVFKKFKCLVEKQSEKVIKVLRTYGEGEYMSNKLKEFCESEGLICYKHVPSQLRRKLDDKGTPHILIGYHSIRGYRLYEPRSGQVSISRDSRILLKEEELSAAPIVNKNLVELVDPPSNKKPIILKWIYKVKVNLKGEVVKHKAKLMAKGFLQKAGNNYGEVYAPIVRIEIVKLPKGFVVMVEGNMVYKLKKTLYGLKQTPRAWNRRIDSFLRLNMQQSNLAGTLAKVGLVLEKETDKELVDPTYYRKIVECLRYLCNTRPDLNFSVGLINRFMQELGILFPKGEANVESKLIEYSNSDWCGDKSDRKSTVGYIFFYGGAPISWSFTKEPVIALSSCKAKYIATSKIACQAVWLDALMKEVQVKNSNKVKLLVDNKSVIDLARHSSSHGRRKHIEIRFHFLREQVNNEKLKIEHYRIEFQFADIITKALKLKRIFILAMSMSTNISSMVKQTLSVITLLLLLFFLREVEGAKRSHEVKLFVFGDSYVDTGNSVNSESYNLPSGITFPGKPAGRFSDGCVLTDYIASFFKIKSPTPYTSRNSSELQYGMNFAYGGTGIFDTLVDGPNMTVQIDSFEKLIKQKVYTKVDLESSVALVNAAGNDYATFLQRKHGSIQDIAVLTTSLIRQMSLNLRRIHKLGINKILVGLLEPIGCMPLLTVASSYEKCLEPFNLISQNHSQMLLQIVQELNKELRKPVFVTLDLYNSFLSIIATMQKRHSENPRLMNPLQPCCEGVGIEYSCGNVDEKGEKKYLLCKKPELSFFWEGVHLSQNG
ncbi:GDSL esterase/lipase, partial [Mucuna pruriens]